MRSWSTVVSLLVLSLALVVGCGRDEEPSFRVGRRDRDRAGSESAEANEAPRRPAAEREATPVQARPPRQEQAAPRPEAPTLVDQPTPPVLLQPASVTAQAPAR
ncbi:MAG: hypothetical protein J0L92_41085, partial [Deltaproteobacteria bacterium]|nr:hypothetical protein [Deltaproteobacteria bacterium]